MKKIILALEVLLCTIAVIFAFFYGAIYSESIQKAMPFFFGDDDGVESQKMEIEMDKDMKEMSVEDEINDFFKDDGMDESDEMNGSTPPLTEPELPANGMAPTLDQQELPIQEGMQDTTVNGAQEDADALQRKLDQMKAGQEEVESIDTEQIKMEAEKTIEETVQEVVEPVEKKGLEMMQPVTTPTEPTEPVTETPIIEGETTTKEDIGEVQEIQETDSSVPSDAEEVQVEIGNEPVKIEGVQGIESEEIDLEDLEEMQRQQEIDIDSDLIDL